MRMSVGKKGEKGMGLSRHRHAWLVVASVAFCVLDLGALLGGFFSDLDVLLGMLA